tara:strand:+ start:1260 stop:2723 length:1464 start_codon:yes stop_codon:yes gene_type:complete
MRTLICIVSYEAEKHIQNVLLRLPMDIWNSPEYHVLLSDDASRDNTVKRGSETLSKLGDNYTVLKIKKNQGYGGNQKICYRYAVENHFDIAVLVHGDGQYAPELSTTFVKLIKEQQCEVVLGSRMMDIRSAINGNMPYYKILGNLFLTRIQNFLCNTNLTEFHTGYRAYTTEFLKAIEFELNSDGFHFDTEILLQAFHKGAHIHEFSIPTHYGEEVCRVPGLRYGYNIILASLIYKFQKIGLLTSLKFRHSSRAIYQGKTKDPHSTHSMVLNYIKGRGGDGVKKLLDIGCGPGHIAEEIKKLGLEITGIDFYKPEFTGFDEFIKMDLERDTWLKDITHFDLILLLDVIEHLSNPEKFLLSLRYKMNHFSIPKVIITVPNIGFIMPRINLLFGLFNYADRGILDITHKRFFTLNSFKRMLAETGFEVLELRGIGVPFRILGKGFLFKIFGQISMILAKIYPSLFAFQIMVVTKPKLTSYQLLTSSRQN